MTDDILSDATVIVRNKVSPSPSDTPTERADSSDAPMVNNDLMMSFFKLSPPDMNQKMNEKLAEIYQFASSAAEDGDEFGILEVLRDVKYRLGAPSVGMSDVEHVYQYVKLRDNARRLDARAKAMEA